MGDAWRIGVDPSERTALVHRGLFHFVRNPIFTAMIVTGVGVVVLLPTVATIGSLLLLVLGVVLHVRTVEEPYLSFVHGTSYLDYAACTGRFLPGIGRMYRGLAAGRTRSRYRGSARDTGSAAQV